MRSEILINVTPRETRVALVENGELQEISIERSNRRGIVGNIYKGKVRRVLPGMQAAFVDIGLERAAFLHVSGVVSQYQLPDDNIDEKELDITDWLHDGQEIVVQVVKDPVRTKGARLTTQITLPSRYLVYMPNVQHVGVSLRIGDETERQRLKSLIEDEIGPEPAGGYIARTAAGSMTKEEVHEEVSYLNRLWNWILESTDKVTGVGLIHEELPLAMRCMRDLVNDDVERIRIDSRETYEKVHAFAKRFIPNVAARIELYPGERPLFELFEVENELRGALERKVMLKSGGYLVIDATEALTAIDVNTGGFVGSRNLEQTVFTTNLEATQVIGRELRRRNLGGIIIIDFIDMKSVDHRDQVIEALEKSLARDHSKTSISDVSSLGLVQITRKRTTECLQDVLCEPCPTCNHRGRVKSAETLCYEIFREILREARAFNAKQYTVLASQSVIDRLNDEESEGVLELEEFIGKPIRLQVEPSFTQEQYDVILT